MGEHDAVVSAHEEKFKNIEARLSKLETDNKEVIQLAKEIVEMRVELKTAIDATKNHINGGTKYRLMIIGALIGLVGIWHAESVKYGVFQEKITTHELKIDKLDKDNADLNFEIGKVQGQQNIK